MSLIILSTSKMAQGGGPVYSDDVFATTLYTGTGAARSVVTGVDLLGKGGLAWFKPRNSAKDNLLFDTNRGANRMRLSSNLTVGDINNPLFGTHDLKAFTATGFDIGTPYTEAMNVNGQTQVVWSFAKAPKFFDIVTYTGDGTIGRVVPHGLGVQPGLICVKGLDTTYDWIVYHRSQGVGKYGSINISDAFAAGTFFGSAEPTSAGFSLGPQPSVNGAGLKYVAYVWAHDPAADGIIQCGSYVGNGSSGSQTINLGFEPQFVLIKAASAGGTNFDWIINDTLRGLLAPTQAGKTLRANLSSGEFEQSTVSIVADGFVPIGESPNSNQAGVTYIYLAIRRPNKPPTSGTEVYNAIARTGTGAAATITGVGFAPDLLLEQDRSMSYGNFAFDRLRGKGWQLNYNTTAAETFEGNINDFSMDGLSWTGGGVTNASSGVYINHFFRRAPGFFDVVCYTGTGVARTVPHGLGAVPELMIVKPRSFSGASSFWSVYYGDETKFLRLNESYSPESSYVPWGSTKPTVSGFSLTDNVVVNGSGYTYVAYLFATLAGISKVGSYTGNGGTQKIECGFSTGARFILIKRTDSTGDWYVWDTARGIVSANDPHLSLNTTAAEVMTDDSVDPAAAGFIVNQNTATNINVSGGAYIFLAIA